MTGQAAECSLRPQEEIVPDHDGTRVVIVPPCGAVALLESLVPLIRDLTGHGPRQAADRDGAQLLARRLLNDDGVSAVLILTARHRRWGAPSPSPVAVGAECSQPMPGRPDPAGASGPPGPVGAPGPDGLLAGGEDGPPWRPPGTAGVSGAPGPDDLPGRPHPDDPSRSAEAGPPGERARPAPDSAAHPDAGPRDEPPILEAALEDCLGPDGLVHLSGLLDLLAGTAPGRLVTLTGASGGLGASTLTLMLARSLAARGCRVAVVDADPAGSLGLLTGDAPGPGLRWADLPPAERSFRPARLAGALPAWLGIPLLTGDERGGPAHAGLLEPVVRALTACHDVVLLDLPRGWTPPRAGCILLLTALDLRSATAASVICGRLASVWGPVSLVVRPEGQDVDASELEVLTGCRVLGVVPSDRSVRQRIARGDDVTRGRGAARRAARRLAELLAEELAAASPVGAP